MRKLPFLLLAGAVALGGSAAYAASNDVHHMTLRMPDGGIAQIEYTGNVAPKISVAPMTQADFDAFAPRVSLMPIADFAQMQVAMDRQMSAMFQQIDAMNAQMAQAFAHANGPIEATLHGLPQGSSNTTTLISMANGGNFCERSMEVSIVNGKRSVTRQQSGNCGDAAADHVAPAKHHGDPI
ncbi:MAG TPA: hypothetical protein VG867_08440 [Rhizomicrobium sp.]|nr:hypothetical protein [Rhizomicrobium sp.]